MAQTTYEQLITRIEVATDSLEADVIALDEFMRDIGNAVDGDLATQVKEAKDAATLSTTKAGEAAVSASNAKTSETNAKATADKLLATAPFQEAPKDGRTYGRNNGGWLAVEGGGSGGGVGTVTSVNGAKPDSAGNVTVVIPTKTSQLANDAGFITAANIPVIPTKVSQLENDSKFAKITELPTKLSQLTNDTQFIKQADVKVQEAPMDEVAYNRKNGAWVKAENGGAGGVPDFLKIKWQNYYGSTTTGSLFKFYCNTKAAPYDSYTRAALYNKGLNASGGVPDAKRVAFLTALQDGWTTPYEIPLVGPNEAIDAMALAVSFTQMPDGVETFMWQPVVKNGYIPATGKSGLFVTTTSATSESGSGDIWTGKDANGTVGLGHQFKRCIPAGHYWFEAPGTSSASSYISAAGWENVGLPASMRSSSFVISVVQTPGTANTEEYTIMNPIITLAFGTVSGSTANKGIYQWDLKEQKWTNVGVGTA